MIASRQHEAITTTGNMPEERQSGQMSAENIETSFTENTEQEFYQQMVVIN